MPNFEFATLHKEMIGWRHHLHAHPETAFEEFETSAFLVQRLEEFGLECHVGLAGTGIVANLSTGEGPTIGLRADMDGLNLHEVALDRPHASKRAGKMHGCGHDGHMTMLLGAAKYLSQTRKFGGTVRFIFQPAEENEAGAQRMVNEGLFERFPVDQVFGMHNWPALPANTFAIKPGAMMAACDFFEIEVVGVGAHAAMPDQGVDPIVCASNLVMALQTIASRNIAPHEAVVVSVTKINGGTALNVLPDVVTLAGTVRTLSPDVRAEMPKRLRKIAEGIASSYGAGVSVKYIERYPATINHPQATELCAAVAAELVGEDKVWRDPLPSMGAEDFAFMLEKVPGAYIWLGAGGIAGGCMLHNPGFDFNDDVLLLGSRYWTRLVERLLPLRP